MRSITIKIDKRVLQQICEQKKFAEFVDGCVREPSQSDKILFAMIDKIQSGKDSLELGVKDEEIQ